MPGDLPKLRPVDPTTVANRFRFNGRRKRCRQGDDLMAEITADHLAKARPRDGTRPKWRQISEGIPVTVMGGFLPFRLVAE